MTYDLIPLDGRHCKCPVVTLVCLLSVPGSRRSSLSGFRDTTLANLESELLNTSFTRWGSHFTQGTRLISDFNKWC